MKILNTFLLTAVIALLFSCNNSVTTSADQQDKQQQLKKQDTMQVCKAKTKVQPDKQPKETEELDDLKGKKIVMVIASNAYRDEEFEQPFEYFKKCGAKIIVASSTTENATGMMGGSVKPDKLLSDVEVTDFDAIVFVGGMGASEYFDNEKALDLVKQADEKKLVIAAICIAPNILNNAGVLNGKKATAWSFNNRDSGVIVTNNSVECDGNIVTANGPGVSREFAKTISKTLKTKA